MPFLPRSSFVADLRILLRERDFRRLFATRLISQTGDGVFTAGLGSYVFFNKTNFPNPASAAVAFAVLYLPYSLIGPFAGVFIDRWSRRQILVYSAVVRSLFVVLTAALVAGGQAGRPAVHRRAAGARGEPVLPVLAVRRAAARGARGQAGDGQLGVADRGRHHGLGRRAGRPGRARGHRQRADRLGHHPAGRRRLLPAGRGGGPDHAARPARAGSGRAGRRAGARRDRGRGRRAGGRGPVRAPAPRGGRRARRHRGEPAALRGPLSHVHPAVPELLLPVGRGQRRAQPLHRARPGLRGGLRLRGADHPRDWSGGWASRCGWHCCWPAPGS